MYKWPLRHLWTTPYCAHTCYFNSKIWIKSKSSFWFDVISRLCALKLTKCIILSFLIFIFSFKLECKKASGKSVLEIRKTKRSVEKKVAFTSQLTERRPVWGVSVFSGLPWNPFSWPWWRCCWHTRHESVEELLLLMLFHCNSWQLFRTRFWSRSGFDPFLYRHIDGTFLG